MRTSSVAAVTGWRRGRRDSLAAQTSSKLVLRGSGSRCAIMQPALARDLAPPAAANDALPLLHARAWPGPSGGPRRATYPRRRGSPGVTRDGTMMGCWRQRQERCAVVGGCAEARGERGAGGTPWQRTVQRSCARCSVRCWQPRGRRHVQGVGTMIPCHAAQKAKVRCGAGDFWGATTRGTGELAKRVAPSCPEGAIRCSHGCRSSGEAAERQVGAPCASRKSCRSRGSAALWGMAGTPHISRSLQGFTGTSCAACPPCVLLGNSRISASPLPAGSPWRCTSCTP